MFFYIGFFPSPKHLLVARSRNQQEAEEEPPEVVVEDEEHQEVVLEVAVELLGASAAEVVVQVLPEAVAASHEEDLELVEALGVASVDVVKILSSKLLTSVLFLVLFSIWRWGKLDTDSFRILRLLQVSRNLLSPVKKRCCKLLLYFKDI